MGFFRSELMRLYQLTIPKDESWNVMNEFGDLNLAHFLDLNKEESTYSLPYTKKIKECEAAERKLAYLLKQCEAYKVKVRPPIGIQSFEQKLDKIKDDK